jgi:hypothetical protein
VLVGCGRAAVHTSPSISLELVCGPFTPYVSLGRQAIVSLHHQPSCQIMSTTYHKINSISSKQNNIIVNETTQIAHSLTQSGVQGSSTDASASSRSETLHTQLNGVSNTCLHQSSKNILSSNLTHHNEGKSFIIIKIQITCEQVSSKNKFCKCARAGCYIHPLLV